MERDPDIPEEHRGDEALVIVGLEEKQSGQQGIMHLHGRLRAMREPEDFLPELERQYPELRFRVLQTIAGINARAAALLEEGSLPLFTGKRMTRLALMQLLMAGRQ